MEKYVCIHGHFYQPPRENPWLDEVELQDSAYPYHDWNTKITEECYRQNAASRILGPDKKIIDISNNYSEISFDFGPLYCTGWKNIHQMYMKALLKLTKKVKKNSPVTGQQLHRRITILLYRLPTSEISIPKLSGG